MKIFYVTVNNADEANAISRDLLENRLAVCTNYFPIHCMYRWQGEIKQGHEVVLIIKTIDEMRDKMESVLKKHITYTHFIAELAVNSINDSFLQWLNAEVSSE